MRELALAGVEGLHGPTKYNGLAESGAVLDPHIICKSLGDCPTRHLVRDEGVAGSNPATPTNTYLNPHAIRHHFRHRYVGTHVKSSRLELKLAV